MSSAAAAVESLLTDLELWDKVREQRAAVVWEQVVGRPIAAKTEVLGADQGVLRVRVASAAWAQELALQEGEIRRRLNAALGGNLIQQIRFSTSGPCAPPQEPHRAVARQPKPGEIEAVRLDDEDEATIADVLGQARDPEVAATLRPIVTAQLKLAKWRRQHGWRPCRHCGELAFDEDVCVACRVIQRGR